MTVRLLVAVALGGALGSVLRYVAELVVPDPAGFPVTTLAVNVVGSFLLALLPAVGVVRRSTLLPVFLGPGVLGGFTTLSLWSEQTRALVAEGATATAATYVVGTLALCLGAVAAADRLSTLGERALFEHEEGDR